MGGRAGFTETHHHQGECFQRAGVRRLLEQVQSWCRSGSQGSREDRPDSQKLSQEGAVLSYVPPVIILQEGTQERTTRGRGQGLFTQLLCPWQIWLTPEKLLLTLEWNQAQGGRRTGRNFELLLLKDTPLHTGRPQFHISTI